MAHSKCFIKYSWYWDFLVRILLK